MPRTPLTSAATLTTNRVSVTLAGETLVVDASQWERAGDELVARHPNAGAPTVTRLDAPAAPQTPAPSSTAPTTAVALATRPSPLPTAPAPVRGETVDLEGAMRSGADLLAAEAAGFAPAQPYFTRGTMVIGIGVENACRSRIEHDAKPTVADACYDFAARIAAEARADEIVRVSELSMGAADGAIYDHDGEGRYVLTRPAFDSLCTRLGFGGSSYLGKCWPELRAHNANAWLESISADEAARAAKHAAEQAKLSRSKQRDFEPSLLRFRTRSGSAGREAFGVVSPSYAAFDVDRVAEALALAAPRDARCVVDYDGTKARFEVMFHSDIAPEKYVAGEFFKAGVVINTNDTGGGALRGSAVVFQNLCLNLICIDEARADLFSLRHSGSVAKLTAGFRAGFEKALGRISYFLKAWNYAVEDDVVAAARAADADVPMSVEEALPGLFTAIVERELVPVRGRTEIVVPQLMQMWREDTSAAAGPTRAAVVNAFTRHAHKVNDDAFFADDVQKAAGQLLFGRKGAKPAPLPWMPVEA